MTNLEFLKEIKMENMKYILPWTQKRSALVHSIKGKLGNNTEENNLIIIEEIRYYCKKKLTKELLKNESFLYILLQIK